jgi:hypothetical protein
MRGSGASKSRCEAGGEDTVDGVPAGAGAGALGIGARDDFPPQARAVKARTARPPLVQVFTDFMTTLGD